MESMAYERSYTGGMSGSTTPAPPAPEDCPTGQVSAAAGRAAVEYVFRACDLALAGEADAVVTAPLNKAAMNLAGFHYAGHTELLAERTRAGLDAARRRGRVGGRRRRMTPGKVESARKLLKSGMPPRDVAQSLGVSIPTLYRWVPASSL